MFAIISFVSNNNLLILATNSVYPYKQINIDVYQLRIVVMDQLWSIKLFYFVNRTSLYVCSRWCGLSVINVDDKSPFALPLNGEYTVCIASATSGSFTLMTKLNWLCRPFKKNARSKQARCYKSVTWTTISSWSTHFFFVYLRNILI